MAGDATSGMVSEKRVSILSMPDRIVSEEMIDSEATAEAIASPRTASAAAAEEEPRVGASVAAAAAAAEVGRVAECPHRSSARVVAQ